MAEEIPTRILLVDDTEANRYALSRMLETAYYEVIEADCGRDALRLVREIKPDLVVLDVRLPDISGYQVCHEIKADPTTAHIPVLQISASFVKAEDRARGLEGGADGYLTQPTEKPVFLATINALLRVKRVEAELREAKELAEAANIAKDQFLAALSHELRTPLTPILATVQALELDEASLPPAMKSSLEIIRRNVELEARLIDDLLDITRIAKGKIELALRNVDLHEIVHAAMNICLSDARHKRQNMVIELTASRHHLLADGARLQQVVWNLLKNAIKFTPAGGRIELRTADGPDGRVVLTVSDTGIGIERETISRIFTAFEQGGPSVTRQFGGLGLGLSISRKLVELHGGVLRAESPGRDRGATFTVEFTTVSPETTEISSSHPSRTPQVALNILLVEDHEDSNRSLTRILEAVGHRVWPTHRIEEARKAAQCRDFDLLISDISLPDGDGLQLMRELKSVHGLNGIALSGYGTGDDRTRSAEAGFLEHLIKPVNLHDLEAAIARVGRSRY